MNKQLGEKKKVYLVTYYRSQPTGRIQTGTQGGTLEARTEAEITPQYFTDTNLIIRIINLQ